MVFTFNVGDLVKIGPGPVGQPGLYIITGVSGANLTLDAAEGGTGSGGLVVPSSRVTSHWASA